MRVESEVERYEVRQMHSNKLRWIVFAIEEGKPDRSVTGIITDEVSAKAIASRLNEALYAVRLAEQVLSRAKAEL